LTSSAGHTQYEWTFDWLVFLPAQAHTIAVNLIPFWPIFQVEPGVNAPIFIVVVIIIYTFLKYFKDRGSINKLPIIMILSGFFWAIPMKNFAALHRFQSIFYAGFTIGVFILFLSRINSKLWRLLALNIALAFIIAVSLSNESKIPNTDMNRIADQLQNISRNLPEESKIYFDGDKNRIVKNCRYAADLFLGHCWFTSLEEAEYAVSANPNFGGQKLTCNLKFNLFKISHRRGN
jgi:hypothetical protein